MLYHLIYVSSATVEMAEEDFVELLLKSRQNNLNNHITGMLLYTSGSFIQYIEGAKGNILNLMEKIKQDDRHQDIEIIDEGDINQRCFNDWSLDYHTFATGELEQMVGCQHITKNADAVKRTVKLIKLFCPNHSGCC